MDVECISFNEMCLINWQLSGGLMCGVCVYVHPVWFYSLFWTPTDELAFSSEENVE